MAFDEKFVKEYDRYYNTQEGMYVDEKQKEMLVSTLRFKTGDEVLEVGSGTGRYVQYFEYLGLKAKGIEPNAEMLRVAYMKSTLKQDQIIRGWAENIPFRDKSFDSVVFMNTLEYIDDKEKAIKEAYRVTRDKIGIGFLNRWGITNYTRSRNKQGMFKNAEFFSRFELEELVRKTLEKDGAKIGVTVNFSIYMPIKIAYLAPIVDDIMERTNWPLGNFGVMLIKKSPMSNV